MAKVISLAKTFDHRWKTDPRYCEGFDYDHPKYADVADDLKWMLPMREQQRSPEVRAYHAAMNAKVTASLRRKTFKIV